MACRAGLLLLTATLASAQPPTPLNLMPWPAKVEMGQGSFAVGPAILIAFTGYSEPRPQNAARGLGEIARESSVTLLIHCDHASEPIQQLSEDESYHLQITPRQ